VMDIRYDSPRPRRWVAHRLAAIPIRDSSTGRATHPDRTAPQPRPPQPTAPSACSLGARPSHGVDAARLTDCSRRCRSPEATPSPRCSPRSDTARQPTVERSTPPTARAARSARSRALRAGGAGRGAVAGRSRER